MQQGILTFSENCDPTHDTGGCRKFVIPKLRPSDPFIFILLREFLTDSEVHTEEQPFIRAYLLARRGEKQ